MTVEPLGVRLKNPGNLRAIDGLNWLGKIGSDQGFVIFDTVENGLRAMVVNLKNQQVMHGLRTVRGIISRYAPPSENDTAAYIKRICEAIHVGPDDQINLLDPEMLVKFAVAVIWHEQACCPYKWSLIEAIANKVLGITPPREAAHA